MVYYQFFISHFLFYLIYTTCGSVVHIYHSMAEHWHHTALYAFVHHPTLIVASITLIWSYGIMLNHIHKNIRIRVRKK